MTLPTATRLSVFDFSLVDCEMICVPGERTLVLDKLADVVFRDTLSNDSYGHVSGRQHREHHHAQDISVDDLQSLGIDKLLSPEMHHAHSEIGGQRDEHRVDEKQIEGSEEERSLAHGQSIASRAERRHEGRGDGYARDDIALALSRERQNTS